MRPARCPTRDRFISPGRVHRARLPKDGSLEGASRCAATVGHGHIPPRVEGGGHVEPGGRRGDHLRWYERGRLGTPHGVASVIANRDQQRVPDSPVVTARSRCRPHIVVIAPNCGCNAPRESKGRRQSVRIPKHTPNALKIHNLPSTPLAVFGIGLVIRHRRCTIGMSRASSRS